MTNEQKLAKAVDIALQLIKSQQGEINFLKISFFALRDSLASGKPPLRYDAAQKQVLSDLRESGKTLDDIYPLLAEQMEIVRSLSKQPPKKKPARKRV